MGSVKMCAWVVAIVVIAAFSGAAFAATLTVNSTPIQSVDITATPTTYSGTTNYSKTASGSISLTAPTKVVSGGETYYFQNWAAKAAGAQPNTLSLTTSKTTTAFYTVPAPVFRITEAEQWVPLGEAFTISLQVEGLPVFKGLEMGIDFDANGLAVSEDPLQDAWCQSYAAASWPTAVELNDPASTKAFSLGRLSGGWLSGAGTVTTISFFAIAPGNYTITFYRNNLADQDGNAVVQPTTLETAIIHVESVRLTVNSSPIQGVAIEGDPMDITNYAYDLPPNYPISLTAPASVTVGADTYNFVGWSVNSGAPDPTQPLELEVAADTAVEAIYQISGPSFFDIFVESTPITGVAISGDPAGATNYSASVADGAQVSLQAPASLVIDSHTIAVFEGWLLNGTPQTGNPLEFAVSAEATATATYRIDSFFDVFIQSAPVAGINITGSPAGATNYMATLLDGSLISLTAPVQVTVGGSIYAFANWNLNGVNAGGNPLEFTLDSDATALAVYEVAIAPGKISGSGWIQEPNGGRATLFADIEVATGGVIVKQALRWSRLNPRMLVISAGITSFSVHGETVTVSGTCAYNSQSGYTYVCEIIDNAPDGYVIAIYNPSGQLVTQVSGPLSVGNFVIQ